MIQRLLPLALLFLLGACAFMAPIQPASTFYVMRHLHTTPGQPDPSLTSEGQRQALLLTEWFGDVPPAAIFVSSTRRAQETAAPLAARLGLTPIVYDPRNTPALMADILKEPPPVLIVGHSNTVPEIVQALGGARPSPIAEAEFGDIWIVSGPRRTVTRARIDQPRPAVR